MMKKLKLLWAVLLVMGVFSACVQDFIVQPDQEGGEAIHLILTADKAVGTKSILTPNEAGNAFGNCWDENETIYVIGNQTGYVGKLSCTTANGKVQGVFEGTVTKYPRDTQYTLYYLGNPSPDFVEPEIGNNTELRYGIQSGKLEDLARYDVAWFSVAKSDLTNVSGNTYSCSGVLSNQLFTFIKFTVPASTGMGTLRKMYIMGEGLNTHLKIDNKGELSANSEDGCGIDIAMDASGIHPGDDFYVAVPVPAASLSIQMNFIISKAAWADCYYVYNTSPRIFRPGKFVTDGGNGSAVPIQAQALPQGAVPHPYSLSSTVKAYISRGNLQYIGSASPAYWRFAERPWHMMRSGPSSGGNVFVSGASSYNGIGGATDVRDLFCWATSGDNSHNNKLYQPWKFSPRSNDYLPQALSVSNKTDWGFNKIQGGENTQNRGWRILTFDEYWEYLVGDKEDARQVLLNGRTIRGNRAKSKAIVAGVKGLILLPDVFYVPQGLVFNEFVLDYWTLSYTSEQWEVMELHGAVFLPAAGWIYHTHSMGHGSPQWKWQGNGKGAYWVNGLRPQVVPSWVVPEWNDYTYNSVYENEPFAIEINNNFNLWQGCVFDRNARKNWACAVRLVFPITP